MAIGLRKQMLRVRVWHLYLQVNPLCLLRRRLVPSRGTASSLAAVVEFGEAMDVAPSSRRADAHRSGDRALQSAQHLGPLPSQPGLRCEGERGRRWEEEREGKERRLPEAQG